MKSSRLSSWVSSAIIAAAVFTPISNAVAAPDLSTYTRPLLFAPEDNHIFLTSPQLKWQLEGDRLSFGGISFDARNIKFQVSKTSSPNIFNMGFNWPTNLATDGVIQIRKLNKVIWQEEVDADDIRSWRNRVKVDPELQPIASTTAGALRRTLDELKELKNEDIIRACFVRKISESEKLEVCSSPHRAMIGADGKFDILDPLSNAEPNVMIAGQSLGVRGFANFPGKKPIQFLATFSTGATIGFTLVIPQLKMLDVVWKADQKSGKELLVFTGQGAKPIGQVKELVVPMDHFWSATGLGDEIIWQTNILKSSPLLRVLAPFNIPFTYIVQFTDLPDETDRLYISSRTGAGTYSSSPKIYGLIPSQAKLASKEKRVRRKSAKEFQWYFNSPNKGERNKARISLFKTEDGKEKEWVAHYQLYRGYPFQAALRLTGLGTEQFSTAIVGEGSITYFPENLLLDSYLLDYHRWGFSARYFRTITPLKILDENDAVIEVNPFTTYNLDARYNLRPGLWNRDELFGPMISFTSIKILDYEASIAGVGFFWARTMPLVFDKLFNLFPLMNYPKYLDVELIYYPKPVNSLVESAATYYLNFAGRIFWTKRFFGEAGFGYKRFNFVMNDAHTTQDGKPNMLDFGIGYGTAGLGLTF